VVIVLVVEVAGEERMCGLGRKKENRKRGKEGEAGKDSCFIGR